MYNGITLSSEAQKSFYPTPAGIANELVSSINWRKVKDVLEPSAGTGNLIKAIMDDVSGCSCSDRINVDAIEIDPSLRAILSATFSEKAVDELKKRKDQLRDSIRVRQYRKEEVSAEEILEADLLAKTCSAMEDIDVRIVHDDFLTFDSRKHYDLILMNPPFENGDEHLLKAIRMQKENGGMIRCILNAETLKNPFTNRRKMLLKELQELGATIAYRSGAFVEAERSTDVEIAIINVDVPVPVRESDIFSRLKKAAEEKEYHREVTDLVVNDTVQQVLMNYRIEVDAGCELIRQYIDLLPYIRKEQGSGSAPILELNVHGHRGSGASINEYIRDVRKKYWSALFQNPAFVSQLTSNLQNDLYHRVNEMANYDFTEFNIKAILAEMNLQMYEGIKETILELFERLTARHSFYNESSKNIHYYNGWSTNLAYKIGEKVILPVNGIFSTYSWEKDTFSVRNAIATLSDIEKALNYLDGNLTCPVDLEQTLQEANRCGQTRNIRLKYFDITFYKKGTMHLDFSRSHMLIEKFNIFCAKDKNWLPPSYGKKKYRDMDEREKTIVDEFNGTGEAGSGEFRYDSIVSHAGYYLAGPNTKTLMLEGEAK